MMPEQTQLLKKGQRNLKAARRLIEGGDYDIAVSRAYYAMFYVAKAAALQSGKRLTTHRGVHQVFWEHCVKPGRVSPQLHQMLCDAFDQRLTGDYQETAAFTREDAERLAGHADAFLHAVIPLIT